MSDAIRRLHGIEILDSRGRPTVMAVCELESGARGNASVPSGASRGAAEALELRDGDSARYRGLGCRQAAAHIGGEIAATLVGREIAGQAELDQALVDLDGTVNKARLGANAILAVSLAFARARAAASGQPLYAYAGAMDGTFSTPQLPRPMINLFSGGKHAGGQVPIQDLLIMPMGPSMDEIMQQAVAVFQCAAEIMQERYGMRLLTADEGGLAPPFSSIEAMFEDALAAIERAGLRPRHDVRLAVDVAASHFYADGSYSLGERTLDGSAMITQIRRWAADYSLASIEDGLAEDDWEHWTQLTAQLGDAAQIVGDDLLCTNPSRIARAVREGSANALLLKVNQIGTLSEALEANRLARAAGWRVVVSARSGETEDSWLADLAVGWGSDQIKIGSVTQSERLAKYNRLLEIEALDGLDLQQAVDS
jgi:enolase